MGGRSELLKKSYLGRGVSGGAKALVSCVSAHSWIIALKLVKPLVNLWVLVMT
jgi:hypothetical protein